MPVEHAEHGDDPAKSQADLAVSLATEAEAKYLTPPQIARRLGVCPDRIVAMIRRGELRAIDVAEPGRSRPRFRIAPAWLKDWEDKKTVVKPEPKPVRKAKPWTLPPGAKRRY